ncbi:hypothetical protein SAMN05421784_10487 [Xenorhabdus koppenhoeferi]|uniref:Uncharacterized protein n=1 Tax=Xenorhabdus koppenhoeferi TaxID=351659 RepID=A0A1I7FKQ8_9GAMM|nr:hypothetical protein SAMN05421784_10487 [Xenorhabdus koppenhoeferi]
MGNSVVQIPILHQGSIINLPSQNVYRTNIKNKGKAIFGYVDLYMAALPPPLHLSTIPANALLTESNSTSDNSV